MGNPNMWKQWSSDGIVPEFALPVDPCLYLLDLQW